MRSLVLILLSTMYYVHLNAQSLIIQTRKELSEGQINRLTGIFNSVIKDSGSFINGQMSVPAANHYVHPYFIDNTWKSGSLLYKGMRYETGMLKYDTFKDCLVYLHTLGNTSYPVQLNRNFIREFEIDNHQFTYLNDFGKSSDEKLKEGYYEKIYDGNTKLYVRRQKLENLHESISDLEYKEWAYLFIKKEGVYHRITGKSSLLRVLNDRRKEIRSFIRNNNLVSCTKNYDSVSRILQHYDNL